MSVDSVIARARTAYEGVMSTTVVVSRGGNGGTFDPVTLTYTPSTGTSVYSGACLIRKGADRPGPPPHEESGAVIANAYVGKFPADTSIVRGDSVTVTASTYDISLVGLTLWVVDSDSDGWQTTRVVQLSDQIPEVLA
jgi:hypothetical protein